MGNTWLERASHFAFILMCAAVVVVAVQRFTLERPSAAPAPSASMAAGTVVTLGAEMPDEVQGALVLALSTTCQYCTASMPFYRRIAASDAVNSGRLQLIVASIQGEPAMKSYLASHDLPVAAILPAASTGLGIRATPTLVVVDSNRRVVGSWEGELGEERQTDVFDTLAAVLQDAEHAAAAPGQTPGSPERFDLSRLGFGSEATVVIVLASSACAACRSDIDFYKDIAALPRMDGTRRRVVVVATDGVVPLYKILEARGFKPHRLTSGPYPGASIPRVTDVPAVIVIGSDGEERGRWNGALGPEQRSALITAITKGEKR